MTRQTTITREPWAAQGDRQATRGIDGSTWHVATGTVAGRARQLCPGTSDLDFLSDLKGVVDLYPEVSNRAFDPVMAEQKLYRSEVACPPVDERRLGPAHLMRRVFEGIKPDAADPLGNEPGVLSCGQMLIAAVTTREHALARLAATDPKMLVERLPGHLGQLEPNGTTGLALTHSRPVDRI